jgi:lipopolysaccharide heptosyltransferase I
MTTNTYPQITDISQRKEGSPRVLLVRLSAVGDCVQTMPLACAVKQHWPDAHLTWAVEKGAAPLVAACDAVDSIITLPKGFAKSPRLLLRLRRDLLERKFHFSLDPQGLLKSGLVAWLSGAKRRIGFTRPTAREINPWFQTERVASHARHRIPQYLELLRPLAADHSQVRFGMKIPHSAYGRLADFLNQSSLHAGYIVLNPGAGWDSKRWPLDRYAELARQLQTHRMPCVIAWGGEQEHAWAKAIVDQSRGAALLAPPTSLLELAALLQHARLFVGSDTGPLHIAAALNTPCVALFGASSAAICGPNGHSHISLQKAFDESSGRRRRGADNWAMRQITVEAAASACACLLSRQNSRNAA